jgi:thiosulfate/3-mercaptopyruvate sulfurtransferase
VVRLVESNWLRARLGDPGLTIVDARPPTRYLSGHVPNALSVPAEKAFSPDGLLLADAVLADWLGRSGVPSEGAIVLYADGDGQHAAMLAWILEYLGHPDIAFLRTRFESWKDEGGEAAYRPTKASPETFVARPRPDVRASWEDAANLSSRILLDTRSPEEHRGERVVGQDPPGHIPGSLNVPWLAFLGSDSDLLLGAEEVTASLREAGADPDEEIVVYCRAALRASVAWLAMLATGCQVRLYDGSFLDWSGREDLPIEISPAEPANGAIRAGAKSMTIGTSD